MATTSQNTLTTEQKADMVAEATINSNERLAHTPGAGNLKVALSNSLQVQHDRGGIDLDKIIEPERTHSITDRGEGRGTR